MIAILRSTICFSNFIFGIPYINNPPRRSERSYTVTSCPRLFKELAADNPEGPEPITATFFPVRNFGGLALANPCLYPYSMILNSFCLEHTGSPFNPHVQAFSQSAGHTRPVNSGNGFVFLSLKYACSQFPV